MYSSNRKYITTYPCKQRTAIDNNKTLINFRYFCNKNFRNTNQSTGSPFSFLHCGVKPVQTVTKMENTNNTIKQHISMRVWSTTNDIEVTRHAGSSRYSDVYDVTTASLPAKYQTIDIFTQHSQLFRRMTQNRMIS